MYGMGLDMERAGRGLQVRHDPAAPPTTSYPQQGGYGYQNQAPTQPTPQYQYNGYQ